MTKEEIKTDNLTVLLKKDPGCRIILEIGVSKEAAKATHLKAIKAVNKEISIPGFRKGKAPESLVQDQFAKYVKQEWHQILLNTAFQEFVEKTKLFPFSSAQQSIKRAEVKSASLENGATLYIEYEAQPVIPDIDPTSLQLKPVERDTITEDSIEDTIRQIQLHHAKWTPVERSVEEGDFVELTIDSLETPGHNICKDMNFEVVPGKMASWMRKLILGKKVGEKVEGISEKEEGEKTHFEFKPTHCSIEIKKIKTAEVHLLDDELAKKVGLTTIDELRPRVAADLNRRADAAVQDELRAQIEGAILEKYPFDIPASLIEKQRKELFETRSKALPNLSKEEMAERVKELRQEIQQELEKAYRMFFIARKVAQENGINVSENELMQEMMNQIMQPQGQGIINASMNTEEARSKLFINVLSQKVLDFLATKAKTS